MGGQKDVGTCCLCINLRWGVGALCIWQFVRGCICVLGLFVQDIKIQSGGYNPDFRWLQNCVGSLGLIFGITGLMGIYDNKPSWIRVYVYFVFVTLAVSLVVFLADLYELAKCDAWTNNMHSQINYNAPLENVAIKGLCGWTRRAYVVGWIIEFSCLVYFAYVTFCYYSRTCLGPTYLLHFNSMSENDHRKLPFFGPGIGDPHHVMEGEIKSNVFLNLKNRYGT